MKNTFIIIAFALFFIPLHSMLRELKFEPLSKSPHISAIIDGAIYSPHWVDLLESSNIIKIKEKLPNTSKKFYCFEYALSKIANFYDPIIFTPGNPQETSLNIEDYFEQVESPQRNDLVVYITSKENLTINHFGIYKGSDMVRSKWGEECYIIDHNVRYVLSLYGLALFFRLKAKYQDKELLWNHLKRNNALKIQEILKLPEIQH